MIPHDLNVDLNLFPPLEGVYFVGGTTRDLLLDKQPADYDIAVSQNPEIFAKKTAATCGGRLIPMGRAGKRSYRVVSKGVILDITGLDGKTIRDDLERRDITINAMAIELASGKCLDWVGGRRDLAGKQIRMVSEKGFRDDPVRLLRAFRLAATLGFSMEADTLAAIPRNAHLIRLSAGERIRSELYQLLSHTDGAAHMEMMAKAGLLRSILQKPTATQAAENAGPGPAVNQMDLPPAYRHLETVISHPPPRFSSPKADSESALPPGQAAWLKFAAILIGQIRKAGNRSLPDPHQETIENRAQAVCRRLRLSNRETTFITGIVCNHARPFDLHDAYTAGKLTPKAAIRFFMTVDTLAPPLLLLALAEARNSCRDRKSFPDFIRHMLQVYVDTYQPGKALSPLVSGRDLMEVFGLPPSPLISTILARLKEGQISGELQDRASALKLAKKMARELGQD